MFTEHNVYTWAEAATNLKLEQWQAWDLIETMADDDAISLFENQPAIAERILFNLNTVL